MLNVSAETKALLKSDSVYKEMTVVLTASNHITYTYHNEDIYYESFELSESIIDGSDMTVMGCISSEMRITLRNVDNLKENAFDESPITVTMVPYETTRSKNLMPPLYGAGYSDTQNGITFVVNDDLSVTFTGTATANTTIELAHYRVLDAKNTYVSGCPSGTEGVKQGKFTLIRGAFETYYDDLGSDVYIQTQANDICSYAAYFASGQTVNMTFYPMMRLTTQSNTYEAYGEKYVARDQITLFTGYVDSGQYNNDRGWIKITAYDALYHHQSTKCWNWYRSAFGSNGGTARGLRTLMISLFDWLETHDDGYRMDYNSSKTPVILNAVKIKRRLNNKEMTVTDFLKSLCQLNCGFGIVGRNGEFEIRYLNSTDSGTETITYYRGLTEKDYVAVPFDEGITIITNSDDNGVTLDEPSGQIPTPDWDDDTNDNYVVVSDDSVDIFTGKYFITNNGLVKKLSAAKRRKILDILLTNVQTPTYTIDGVTYPCYRFKSHKLECNGLPYLECGDVIIYKPDQSTPAKPFVIANRKLKGIQAMVDTFSLELPNTLKTYGGETSKKKDSNIESEGSVTNLTTASFTENGTYSAYDYDAMGFSSVTVNVSGGGIDPFGTPITAMAIEPITKYDTVYVLTNSTGGQPVLVNSSIPSGGVAFANGNVYFYGNGNDGKGIYYVPLTNLSGAWTLYKNVKQVNNIWQNIADYVDTSNVRTVENLSNGATLTSDSSNNPIDNVLTYTSTISDYIIIHSNWGYRQYSIEDFSASAGAAVGTPANSRPTGLTSYEQLYSSGSNYYLRNYINSGSSNTKTSETLLLDSGTVNHSSVTKSIWQYDKNGDRIAFNSNTSYLCKISTDGTVTDIGTVAYSGSTAVWNISSMAIQCNAEKTKLWANLGNNGLYIVTDLISYSTITGITSANACMFDDYFWTGSQLYKLNMSSSNTMGKTTSKEHTGNLGYVIRDVGTGQTDTAYLLFY